MNEAKPFCISKKEVWEAYKRVKANKGYSRQNRRYRLRVFRVDLRLPPYFPNLSYCSPSLQSRFRTILLVHRFSDVQIYRYPS